LLGAVIGSLTALVAIGLVLIYRANRVINFAQGDLGGFAAILAILLMVGSHWNFWLAMAVGIATAVVLGALVEWAVIRRFFKAPRLILAAATIALAQILVVFEIILPRAWDIDAISFIPTPFDFSFSIGVVVFTGKHVLAIVSVPLVIGGLTGFFRYTRMGIAVRATAESAERAGLLGVPVRRVTSLVWILSALLSALAIFFRATILGVPLGSALGPGLLLRALAPAVIGRMESLPVTFASAVALGIVEASVFHKTGSTFQTDVILFVVILATLLLQRRRQATRAEEAATSTWQATREIRPIPRELRTLPEVRWGVAATWGSLGLLLFVYPLFAPPSRVSLASLILIFGIVGISLLVLTGWAGQISLGQFAFVGFGAAVAGSLVLDGHKHWLLALFAGGFVGAAVAVAIGLPALRIRGLFLAVSTLGFAIASASYFLSHIYFPWLLPEGRIPRPARIDSERAYYFFCLFWLALTVLSARALRRSRTGRVLMATRDNERAAQAYGVNLTAVRLAGFAISGFYAAFAGGLFALHEHAVAITSFQPDMSLAVFLMVVIGGLGSIPGALLGAAFFWGGRYLFGPTVALFTSGAGVLIVLIVFPGGIGQIVYTWRDSLLRYVAGRRGIVVPSLLADTRQAEPTLVPAPMAEPEAATV
jgi:branched-chain amino acid transport system permease protein